MDVVLTVGRQIVVDDKGHLLDINPSCLQKRKVKSSVITHMQECLTFCSLTPKHKTLLNSELHSLP